jgi:hypothetical protein
MRRNLAGTRFLAHQTSSPGGVGFPELKPEADAIAHPGSSRMGSGIPRNVVRLLASGARTGIGAEFRPIFTQARSSIDNWQRVDYVFMPKQKAARESLIRPYKTTGVHLPADLWELLNRVAFERARTKGGRASVSALLVEMIESHRKALELELGKMGR